MPKRRDGNHALIRDGLRQLGYDVEDTADLGDGFPDLLVVTKQGFVLLDKKSYGFIILLEVKMPGQKLTPKEAKFHARFPGPLYVVRSLEMAVETVQSVERMK